MHNFINGTTNGQSIWWVVNLAGIFPLEFRTDLTEVSACFRKSTLLT